MTTGINRNIVECKVVEFRIQPPYLFVLIETSWNVKKKDYRVCRQLTLVLIETSWNVKSYHLLFNVTSKSY